MFAGGRLRGGRRLAAGAGFGAAVVVGVSTGVFARDVLGFAELLDFAERLA
jgi:hypothetical protein